MLQRLMVLTPNADGANDSTVRYITKSNLPDNTMRYGTLPPSFQREILASVKST